MSFKTVPQMFQHLVSERPTLKTFYTKTENGWEGVELADLQVMVEDFANGLKNLGINDNDKVAIIGANSVNGQYRTMQLLILELYLFQFTQRLFQPNLNMLLNIQKVK